MTGQDDRDRLIRERAHQLWEADGKPHGRDQEFWFRAEQAIAQEHGPDKPDMTETPPL